MPHLNPPNRTAPTATRRGMAAAALMAVLLAAGLPASAGQQHAPRAIPAAVGAVTALAFSPSGKTLAVGRLRSVALVDVANGRTQRIFSGVEGAVTSILFTADSAVLAAGSGMPGKDGQVAFWDIASGRRIRSLAAHNDLIYGIALRPDGRQLAAVSYDHQVSLWKLGGKAAAAPAPRFLRDHTDSVYGVAYSPSGAQLATAAADRTIKVWDPDSGKRLYTLSESTADQYTVAYRPGGRQLAAGGVDKTLRVWNLDKAGGTLARSAFAHDGAILRALYSHAGGSLFTSGEDNTVKEWDADTLAARAIYPKQPDWPQSLALSPDDRLLAVGRYNGSFVIYETATHRPRPSSLRGTYPQPPPETGRGKCDDLPPTPFLIRSPRSQEQTSAGGSGSPFPASKAMWSREAGARARAWEVRSHDGSEQAPASEAAWTREAGAIGGCKRIREADTPGANSAGRADAEIKQQPGNDTIAAAQIVPVPCVVTGALWNGKMNTPAPAHYYRFAARKGQPLTLDVLARRAGSLLDSEIEVLDMQGRPIERAVLRSVGQTEITLNDRDSVIPTLRLFLRPDFGMKDYILAGREVIQIFGLPKGPDDDYLFRSYRGQRTGLFGTTPEHHTVGGMVYKVEVHPPGSTFSPNGMPLTHLTYKNDDGGPLYSRDSYLEFTPPADGDYLVRITDVRGQQGEKFTYKLRIHAPRPDFNIVFSPPAVSVPKDGSSVVTVECERQEGFSGEIAVRVEGLPTGFTATPGVIEAGEASTALRIAAAPGTANPAMDSPSTYRVIATAAIGGRDVTHAIERDPKGHRVSIGAPSNVQIATDIREATVRPGGETVVEARITRLNGFKGRVPLDVRNLPYGVKVDDIGLNGVLINEQETSRKFVIRCEPWVKPQSRLFYVTANVEGGIPSTAHPLTLHITAN